MADDIVNRTLSTSSPSVDLGKSKAVASGLTGTAVAFLTGLGVAYADGSVTGQEWINVALATVLGAAAAFGITYATPTTVTLK
ncbi:MAG TPA: hypothetical protein VGK49_05810 [Ilumatobacteraceae bacterium]